MIFALFEEKITLVNNLVTQSQLFFVNEISVKMILTFH